MSEWKFILIDRNGLRTEVPPALNWIDPEVEVVRDKDHGAHGIFLDYGIEKLQFDGLGADLIMAEYDIYGANGDMRIDILFKCSEDNLYDVFYKGGRLAFDQYSDTCGDECFVYIAVEDSNEVMLYWNNYEQSVNLNSNIAFDQTTILADYDLLNYELELPNRGLPLTTGGNSPGAHQSLYPIEVRLLTPIFGTAIRIRPELTQDSISEIATSDPAGSNSYQVFPQTDPNLYPTALSPILLLEENVKCSTGVFDYKVRLKGHIKEETGVLREIRILIHVINEPWADIGDPVLHEVEILPLTTYGPGDGPDIDFDESFQGSCVIENGNPFLAFINVITFYSATDDQFVYVDWDAETSVKISSVSNCPPTSAKSYMINEVISRVSEAITNDNLRFYSETFGRVDSQPYAINYNPCPGLFSISSGLNVRRKLLIDNSQPGVFLSMKQLFDGLNPIWNIGQTIEPDPNRPGFNRLRFEHWRYFYQDEVSVRFMYPTKVTRDADPTRLFNQLMIGYNKWQAEGTTGLYELMTKRQYRINVNSESNPVEMYTDFICSPYTVEITRRKDQTTQDWQYDNDIFGFCLKKVGDDYSVETFLDNAVDVTNVLDPNTCYNARVRPAVMAMRWFDYVMQGLRTIFAGSKLIFSKGEGNYIASLRTTTCNIEGKVISENEDIDLTDFENLQDAQPITYAELVTFEHPMNYNTFKRIKDDPTVRYKSFAYTCNGVEYEGWLDVLRYRPMTGIATITLIPKNKKIISAPPEPVCLAEVSDLIISPVGDQIVNVYWTASVAGATFWQLIVTKNGQPFTTINTQSTSTAITGLTPGSYSVTVIPFCDTDFPGANYVQGNFEIEAPSFELTLSAILTTGLQPFNTLQLTASGNVPTSSGFSFKFGQCTDNLTIPGGEFCESFPGAFYPTSFALVSFNAGDQNKMVESARYTPGADFGVLTKVVLYNLVGITPAQIKKAVGQTWTLVFI